MVPTSSTIRSASMALTKRMLATVASSSSPAASAGASKVPKASSATPLP